MAKLIKVKSKLKQNADGSWPLAVFERDAAHPDGEIYIADDSEHKVAPTPSVIAAIREGRLEDLSGGSEKAEAADMKDTGKETEKK